MVSSEGGPSQSFKQLSVPEGTSSSKDAAWARPRSRNLRWLLGVETARKSYTVVPATKNG